MSDRLGKVVHVEGGYTIVEILEDRAQEPVVTGYSLFGVGTDIRKLYTLQGALEALRERLLDADPVEQSFRRFAAAE
jgi:hypothetical protein